MLETNLNATERWISVVAGTALAVYGLKRRSIGGLILACAGTGLLFRGALGHCLIYTTLGITTNGDAHDRHVSVPYGHGVRVEKSVTINAPPEQLYAFWRNLENLPLFMSHLQSVEVVDTKRSHWIARGPLGTEVEWDAEIINEVPKEMIAWRSINGSDVDHAGSVHYERAPGNRGTVVKVILRYDPPAGKVGAKLTRLFAADPAHEIAEDLRELKQIIETGAVATTESLAS